MIGVLSCPRFSAPEGARSLGPQRDPLSRCNGFPFGRAQITAVRSAPTCTQSALG